MSLFTNLKFIFLAIFLFHISSYSQTSLKPWEIKIGGNFVNIDSDNVKSDLSIGGPSLSISRLLFGNFSFGGQISLSSDLFFDRINYHLKNCKSLKKITKAKNIKFAGLKGAAHLLIKNYE